MREIKFRAWEESAHNMHPNVESGVYEDPDEIIDFDRVLGLARFEVMQYTGLKDTNGVEIHESDILQGATLEGYAVVKFGSHMTSTDYYASSAFGWYLEDSRGETFSLHEHFTVIGNIYENPELLEGLK